MVIKRPIFEVLGFLNLDFRLDFSVYLSSPWILHLGTSIFFFGLGILRLRY